MALSNELRDALAKRRPSRNVRAPAAADRDALHRDVDADQSELQPPPRANDANASSPSGDDPDANIDPDDVATFTPPPPLPAMPCSWWSALTFGKEDDTVSPADAETCLRLVRARLEATVGRQASQDAVPALIEAGQGGDSGNNDSRDGGRESEGERSQREQLENEGCWTG
jgi:hypothetical protein